jgi:hypothetical protein
MPARDIAEPGVFRCPAARGNAVPADHDEDADGLQRTPTAHDGQRVELKQALATAEDELARHRRLLTATVGWINDPSYDESARVALAQRLGLPGPRTGSRPNRKVITP